MSTEKHMMLTKDTTANGTALQTILDREYVIINDSIYASLAQVRYEVIQIVSEKIVFNVNLLLSEPLFH